jgi:hypothetical protein
MNKHFFVLLDAESKTTSFNKHTFNLNQQAKHRNPRISHCFIDRPGGVSDNHYYRSQLFYSIPKTVLFKTKDLISILEKIKDSLFLRRILQTNMKHYHYIFTGSGLAALMTVYKMAKSEAFKDKTILLLDENSKQMIVPGVSHIQKGNWEPAISKKWDSAFANADFKRDLDLNLINTTWFKD